MSTHIRHKWHNNENSRVLKRRQGCNFLNLKSLPFTYQKEHANECWIFLKFILLWSLTKNFYYSEKGLWIKDKAVINLSWNWVRACLLFFTRHLLLKNIFCTFVGLRTAIRSRNSQNSLAEIPIGKLQNFANFTLWIFLV